LKQISRSDLYAYVEAELKNIETALPETNEYGRVDKTAANFLLSRLYLNAQIYTNAPQWDKAAEYAEKVIGSHYSLASKYLYNFLADNHTSSEIIWSLNMDGIKAKTYGGTTFFVLAQTGGTMLTYLNMGISGGWGIFVSVRSLSTNFKRRIRVLQLQIPMHLQKVTAGLCSSTLDTRRILLRFPEPFRMVMLLLNGEMLLRME
jgi:hypothetical protein